MAKDMKTHRPAKTMAAIAAGLVTWFCLGCATEWDITNNFMRGFYATCGRLGVPGGAEAAQARDSGVMIHRRGSLPLPAWITAMEDHLLPNLMFVAALGVSLFCYHCMVFRRYRVPRCSVCGAALANLKEPRCPGCGAGL
jgi:hypothetical protein